MRVTRRSQTVALGIGVALFVAALSGARAFKASSPPLLLPIPLISQARPWTCGPAALMSVLVYFKVFDDAESELDDALGATPEQGTTVRNLVAGARRFGLEAEARTGLTLDDLKQELARGAAVIVAVQAWPTKPVTDWRKNWEDGHYVVIVGMSEDRIYVMDPSLRTGYGYFDAREFLDRWHDYDLEGSRRIVYERLGIVIRGDFPLSRYPADPTAIP